MPATATQRVHFISRILAPFLSFRRFSFPYLFFSRENWGTEVGDVHGFVVFLHGVGVGWLRLYHQSYSPSRLRTHSHGKVLTETLRRLLRLLHFG